MRGRQAFLQQYLKTVMTVQQGEYLRGRTVQSLTGQKQDTVRGLSRPLGNQIVPDPGWCMHGNNLRTHWPLSSSILLRSQCVTFHPTIWLSQSIQSASSVKSISCPAQESLFLKSEKAVLTPHLINISSSPWVNGAFVKNQPASLIEMLTCSTQLRANTERGCWSACPLPFFK